LAWINWAFMRVLFDPMVSRNDLRIFSRHCSGNGLASRWSPKSIYLTLCKVVNYPQSIIAISFVNLGVIVVPKSSRTVKALWLGTEQVRRSFSTTSRS
jgi:hypothetical protein